MNTDFIVPKEVRDLIKQRLNEVIDASGVSATLSRNLIGNAYVVTVFVGDKENAISKLVLMSEPTTSGDVRHSFVDGADVQEDVEFNSFLELLSERLAEAASAPDKPSFISQIFSRSKIASA